MSAIREPLIFLNHLGHFFYFLPTVYAPWCLFLWEYFFEAKSLIQHSFFVKKKKIKNCSYNSISTFFTIYKKKLWASKRTDVVVHDAFWKISRKSYLGEFSLLYKKNKVDLFFF